jgi:hypothetical protein
VVVKIVRATWSQEVRFGDRATASSWFISGRSVLFDRRQDPYGLMLFSDVAGEGAGSF